MVDPPEGKVKTEMHTGHPGVSRMKYLLEVLSGGQDWKQTLKMQLSSASVVSKINQLHRQLHFNLGVGRQGPGLAYT